MESTVGKGTQFYFVISLPAAELGETGHPSQDLRGKRMVALVQNDRLIRLLAAWAEELALELIVRSDQREKLDEAQPDYLVIDADLGDARFRQVQSHNGPVF